MATRAAGKQSQVTAQYARFQGLTEVQIRLLVEADVMALAEHSGSDCLGTIKALYRRAGVPFTTATARQYAEQATVAKKDYVAQLWWEVVYNSGEESPLRQLLVASRGVESAEARFGTLTRAEYVQIGQRFAAKNNLDEAITAFTKAGELLVVRTLLHRAVRRGEIKIAERAVRELKRQFTKRERKTLLEAAICRMGITDYQDVFVALRAYRAGRRLKTLFLWAYVRDSLSNHRAAQEYARKLGLRLSNAQLSHLYSAARKHDHCISFAIEIAQVLSGRGVRGWKRRLQYLYAQARTTYIGYREPSIADKYGRKCGKPLTIDEIQRAAESFTLNLSSHAEWERREWQWCMDRITALTARAVGAQKAPTAAQAG